MGLPGSGKTTLAHNLKIQLMLADKEIGWLNADEIRKQYNDWDFTIEGRIRQSKRMRTLADESHKQYTICDFVAPLVEMRDIFNPDWTIWMDTIRQGRYADTNAMFVEPETYDFRIIEQNAEHWSKFIGDFILEYPARTLLENSNTAYMTIPR